MKNEKMGVEDLYLAPENTNETDAVLFPDTSTPKPETNPVSAAFRSVAANLAAGLGM